MKLVAVVVVAVALAGCGGGATAGPPTVLEVRVPGAGKDATAFAVGDGRAVTVAHVLRAGQPVFVADRRARVLRVDRRLDVALLAVGGVRAPATGRGGAHSGEPATVRVLRPGGTGSLRATVRRTITARVSARGAPAQVRPALELAASVMPGDSGAPVVDRDGRVVGIVFAQASERDGVAYALDARALGAILTPAEAGARAASPLR
jgi:S1-C subfamily serine protease